MEVPQYLWHWSRDPEIIGSDILDVLLSLSLCRRNAPNYWQNDGLLETCLSVNNLVVGNSLPYFNNNYRKLLVAKANMKVFWICVWIWICVWNVCLNNNSCFCPLLNVYFNDIQISRWLYLSRSLYLFIYLFIYSFIHLFIYLTLEQSYGN